MVTVAKWWGLTLCGGIPRCSRRMSPLRSGTPPWIRPPGAGGPCPQRGALQHWQVGFSEPLRASLLFAYPTRETAQQTAVRGLKHLKATYGRALSVAKGDGPHFTGKEIQGWAKFRWQFHVRYRPQAAGMIEPYKNLSRDKLHAGVDPPA